MTAVKVLTIVGEEITKRLCRDRGNGWVGLGWGIVSRWDVQVRPLTKTFRTPVHPGRVIKYKRIHASAAMKIAYK